MELIEKNNLPLGWRANLAYLLILLFPMAGMSVVGWISYIFAFLTLISLLFVFNKEHQLNREERVLITIFLLGFLAFMLSNTVNGWGDEQQRALGVEIRYLLFVPLYLLIRRLGDAGKLLVWGFLIGSFVILAQTGYELVIKHSNRVSGVYSTIVFGPYSTLSLFVVLAGMAVFNKRAKLFIVPFALMAATIGLAMSGNRGGYMAAIILMFVLLGVYVRGIRLLLVLMLSLILLTGLYNSSDLVSSRVDSAVGDTISYFENKNTADSSKQLGSAGERLEMWKTAIMIFMDNPLVGVGRWNYKQHALQYINEESVHPIAAHDQPHSAYFEMLVSDGLIGFVLFIGMLFYPLTIFIKNLGHEKVAAPIGIILTVGYASFGLTEAAPFIKGNFLSIYLVCLAVFFSWHMQKMHGFSTVSLKLRGGEDRK